METNPPRNSQPETHPDDERGRWPQGWRLLHRMERFPDAWENSYSKLSRSGILLICFEPGGRQVAESRVQPFLVVDLFQELADGGASMGQIAIFVASTSSYLSVFMNDSQAALSHGLPLRDMLISMPLALSRSV